MGVCQGCSHLSCSKSHQQLVYAVFLQCKSQCFSVLQCYICSFAHRHVCTFQGFSNPFHACDKLSLVLGQWMCKGSGVEIMQVYEAGILRWNRFCVGKNVAVYTRVFVHVCVCVHFNVLKRTCPEVCYDDLLHKRLGRIIQVPWHAL